jgi:hypothetical protein
MVLAFSVVLLQCSVKVERQTRSDADIQYGRIASRSN